MGVSPSLTDGHVTVCYHMMDSEFLQGFSSKVCSAPRLGNPKVNRLSMLDTVKRYYKCKENFVILQSIGIIAIKSSESRAVIYNCRYSSEQLNP